jgi:alpha-tubulin suppressor-like RCC1 family protein
MLIRLGVVAAIVVSTAVTLPPSIPTALAAGAQDSTRIDAGWSHTCALSEAGRVKCWGRNRNYQLGDGTRKNRYTPGRVSNLERDVTSIAAGLWHTCALMDAGGVKCWGYGAYGQLGDGTTVSRRTPVDVVGLHGGAVAITAGHAQTCALMDTGGVKCWGATGFGRFFTPVDVPNLTSGVAAISAGGGHTCALTDAGGVVCWGDNSSGQLGDDTTSRRTGPVDVIGLTSGVAAMSAGSGYTCAVTDAGGAKCWGSNASYQLGDGSTAEQELTPIDVLGLTSGVVAISAGIDHTCALTETKGAMCWGRNFWGQLGNGTTSNQRTPVTVSGTATGLAAISVGHEHTCALTDLGAKCWGNILGGRLGDGLRRERLTPVGVSDRGIAHSISAGWLHTCAVTHAGGVRCWGWNGGANRYRILGDGSRGNRSVPVDVRGLESGVTAVSASFAQTCAVTDGGRAKCWGSNYWGQLGDGTTKHRDTPVRVAGLTDVVQIAAGGDHACALTALGGVTCWGMGPVGDGTTENRLTPVDVSGLTSGVTAISAGYGYTCALTEVGGVKCWGSNYTGQLGDGTYTDRRTPIDVPGLRRGIAAISAGEFHACAVTDVGAATCWGTGPLGDGASHGAATPVRVSGLANGVESISVGSGYTCAVVGTGRAKCWGANSHGELGDGTTKTRLTPVDVGGLRRGVATVAAGSEHTCAITDAGGAKCWGDNLYGQVGDGTPTWEPVDVVGFP